MARVISDGSQQCQVGLPSPEVEDDDVARPDASARACVNPSPNKRIKVEGREENGAWDVDAELNYYQHPFSNQSGITQECPVAVQTQNMPQAAFHPVDMLANPEPTKHAMLVSEPRTTLALELLGRLRSLREENSASLAEIEALAVEVELAMAGGMQDTQDKNTPVNLTARRDKNTPVNLSTAEPVPREAEKQRRFSFAMISLREAERLCPLAKTTIVSLAQTIRERQVVKEEPIGDGCDDPTMLTLEDKVFITITKLRKYNAFDVLSIYWGLPKEMISSGVERMLPELHQVMYMSKVKGRGLPTLEDCGGSVPDEFKDMLMCQVVMDCSGNRALKLGDVYKPDRECHHACRHDVYKVVLGYTGKGFLAYVKKPMLDAEGVIVEDEPTEVSTRTGLHPDALDLVEKGVWLLDVMTLVSRLIRSSKLPPPPKFSGNRGEDLEALISSKMLLKAKGAIGWFVKTLRRSEALEDEPWHRSDQKRRAMLVDLCVAMISMRDQSKKKKAIYETSRKDDEDGHSDSD